MHGLFLNGNFWHKWVQRRGKTEQKIYEYVFFSKILIPTRPVKMSGFYVDVIDKID